MKNLIYLIALSFTFMIAACSDSGQDIVSPLSPQIQKGSETGIADVQAYPYKLYQEFPQLTTARVNWYNEKEGIIIIVSDLSERLNNKHIFASIEFVNNKGTVMAFLGDLKSGKFYLYGFNEKDISSINIYYYDNALSSAEKLLPYSKSQLFKPVDVKGWSDGGQYVKVSSYQFITGVSQVYAQLITSEGNQLVFLGKPMSSDFDFPKSEKLNIKDVKLFTLNK